MKLATIERRARARVEFFDLHPHQENLRAEVLRGLSRSQKILPPKLFYDELGSQLFNQICELDEYYLTRAELGLLYDVRSEFADYLPERSMLIEYGCGSSRKIRVVLDADLGIEAYVAVDISKAPLLQLTSGLSDLYPDLRVCAVCADFTAPLSLPLNHAASLPRIAFFPGSSIGNFDRGEARTFLRNVAQTVGTSGGLLIGVDLKKDPRVLHAAYNDARGITARFNKNILTRLNRDCAADFDLAQFEHRAFYDEHMGRVEMHLESRCDQRVRVAGSTINFVRGETIHTENSYKYTPQEFHDLAQESGWAMVRYWCDAQQQMSMHYFRRAA